MDRRTPPSGHRARRLGRRGERRAVRALRRSGYRILARNLRTPAGEVDILAEEGGQTVLVEVKTGTGPVAAPDAIGRLAQRFRPRQRARQRAAARWLRRQGDFRGVFVRHDLVLVTFDGWRSVVTIRRNVFGV